jgi:dUTP pyrophosphatase
MCNLIDIKIIKIDTNATMPEYKTEGAAACDLSSCENVILQPMERKIIRTGIKIEIPFGYYGSISLRSGTSIKTPLIIVNSPGIIDSDYRGEIGLILCNLSNEHFTINIGDRIAQILFHKVTKGNFIGVNELSETIRSKNGYGSTGSK